MEYVKITCTLLFYLSITSTTSAQIFEPIFLRYQLNLNRKSINEENTSFKNVKQNNTHHLEAGISYPIKIGKKGVLIVPIYLHKSTIQSFKEWPSNSTIPENNNLDRLTLAGVLPLNKKWTLIVLAGASQGRSKEVKWDFGNNYYRVGVGLTFKNKKGNSIGATLLYTETSRAFVPVIIYRGASANQKWKFNITVPTLSVIEYSLSKDYKIRFEEKLANEAYDFEDGHSYTYTTLDIALGISKRIKGAVFFNVQGGFSPLHIMDLYEADRTTKKEHLAFGLTPIVSASIYVRVNVADREK